MEHTNDDVESLAVKLAALELTDGEQIALSAALQSTDSSDDEVMAFSHQLRLGDLLMTKGVVSGPIPTPGRFEAPGSESKPGFTLNEELLA